MRNKLRSIGPSRSRGHNTSGMGEVQSPTPPWRGIVVPTHPGFPQHGTGHPPPRGVAKTQGPGGIRVRTLEPHDVLPGLGFATHQRPSKLTMTYQGYHSRPTGSWKETLNRHDELPGLVFATNPENRCSR